MNVKHWTRIGGLSVVALVAALAACATGAETTAAAASPIRQPFLWKVEGGGLTKPAWLFGTIHTGIPNGAPLPTPVESALAAADAYYGEIPMDESIKMVVGMMRRDGKTLSQSIGEDLSKQLAEELKLINPSLTSAPFEPMKTWAIAASLPVLKAQLAGEKPLDARLWEKASRDGKETVGLETIDEQMQLFDSLSEAEQVGMLADTIRQMREGRATGEDPVAEMVKHYLSGDAKKTWDFVDKQFAEMKDNRALAEKLRKQLFTERDRRFAERIAARLKASPGKAHFIAIGCGHFIGPQSVLDHLVKAGYTVTRVK